MNREWCDVGAPAQGGAMASRVLLGLSLALFAVPGKHHCSSACNMTMIQEVITLAADFELETFVGPLLCELILRRLGRMSRAGAGFLRRF